MGRLILLSTQDKSANYGLTVSHWPVMRSQIKKEVKRMRKIIVRKLEDVRTSATITTTCAEY